MQETDIFELQDIIIRFSDHCYTKGWCVYFDDSKTFTLLFWLF